MADLLGKALGTIAGAVGSKLNPGPGEPVKAVLEVLEGDAENVTFMFNPENISVTKSVKYAPATSQGANASEQTFQAGLSRTLKIPSVYFDTFETKKNVRLVYIDKIEKLCLYNPKLHRPPRVLFVWGKFGTENDGINTCTWVVTKVSVTYVMFLSDGKPVRAKVDLELQESEPIKGQLVKSAKESPDHAKVYTVQRGDTLQSISFREYDDPAEWRRIADANSVDDPMALEPGTKLLVPPILK